MSIIGDVLTKLVSGGTSEVTDFFKQRQQLRNQLELTKLNGEIAKEAAWADWCKTNINADEAWEEASIRNSGWKDEYVLILLSIPLIMVFIKPLAPYVLEGFQILDQCPAWYKGMIVAVFLAIYGIRVWRRPTEKING